MPASCTLRLKRFSASSNESPGFNLISLMRMTSALGGHPCDQSLATGNLRQQYLKGCYKLPQPFDNHSIGHAAALADGLEAIAATSALQFVQENGGEARARGSQRVTDSNGAAVHV